MKTLALLILTGALFATLFGFSPVELSNTTVALALMIVLLAVFSDLKEFNFWGISGKKNEVEFKKLEEASLINEESDVQPSPYKIRKANKEDMPNQMERLPENFLAVSFETERLLRLITRSLMRSTEDTAMLTPETVLNYLEDEEVLTPEACEAIEALRELRTRIIHTPLSQISLDQLEGGYSLALSVYEQLKDWLDSAPEKK